MRDHVSTPLHKWIFKHHDNKITHAAAALGVDRSTLHRVMDSAFVIDGVLHMKCSYTPCIVIHEVQGRQEFNL